MVVRNTLAACGLLLCTLFGTAQAAEPEAFKTPEYFASRALEVINAADAYALGYTGKGQVVGIVDTAVRIEHPELAGKADAYPLGFSPDWDSMTHGSHVAGIIAARRDGIGMHGVAFDAGIWSVAFIDTPVDPDLGDYFARRPDVRIFNNSWGSIDWLPFLNSDGTDIYSVQDMLAENIAPDQNLRNILLHAVNSPELVFVFAAGNEGHTSPGIGMASLPRFGGSDLVNWLSVGSVNPSGISRDEASGELVLKPHAVSWFSNLAQGTELFTVMAPGSNIYSLNATTNGYKLESGTSMATPVVSGALALVAQAYPWMSGKQLADTVLTTANSTFAAPEYVVLFEAETQKVHIVSIDGALGDTLSREEAGRLVAAAINEDVAAWIGYDTQVRDVVEAGNFDVVQMTKEEVFGQGILDVGKAVRGIGRLDANRMSATDVTVLDELGGRADALETFNTGGYVAEFSNDISQRLWDDGYHHPDFQTGGSDPELTQDADALAGITRIGLRKTGDGMLILSGTNTYEGATVVDGGILAVARRADGTGGLLEASDVLVRRQGTLMGDGEIRRNVVNGGTLLPGFGGNTLTVGEYEQSADGRLVILFDSLGEHNSLSVSQTASLAGDLLFMPETGQFYANDLTIPLNSIFEAKSIQGAFDAFWVDDQSPTLETRLMQYDPASFSGVVRMTRPADAYSRYADTAGAASLGRALTGVARTAQGDMQALLVALDWSNRDGSDVRRALNQLGPEAYDASARASLGQQKEFNVLILRRMLAGERARLAAAHAAAKQDTPAADTWQAWATPYGAGARQDGHGGAAGWNSAGIGLLAGMDRTFDSGLTLGFHLGLSARRTTVDGESDAAVDTQSGLVGVQGLLAPEAWNGGYLTAQARLGMEQGEMDRNVSFNGYRRHNESDWTGLTGSVLLGGGKDIRWTFESGTLSAGPLGWLEYDFLHRPDLSERDGQASRLHLGDTLYDSLELSLGAHVAWDTVLENNSTLSTDLLAAWRHELLDGTFRTHAAFRGYSADSFSSDTAITGRDALLLQGSLRMTHASGAFLQAEVGGEIFRTCATSVNVGLNLGWEF